MAVEALDLKVTGMVLVTKGYRLKWTWCIRIPSQIMRSTCLQRGKRSVEFGWNFDLQMGIVCQLSFELLRFADTRRDQLFGRLSRLLNG
jgi:hypothetical protein